jgi:Rrf2 family nitric oxide-sensitive transcriptional repressor
MDSMLRISEAANLGIHAMACLLDSSPGNAISVAEIAALLGVSRDHLGKVLQRLAKVSLVTSRRGPKGGFFLGSTSKDATLLQILESIDGPMTKVGCLLGRPVCGGKCILGGLVDSLHEQVHDYLSNTTLGDVAEVSPLPGMLLDSRQDK